MTRHAEIRLVPYSASQMFELVADVERYAEFLPWCQESKILSREERSFLADLTIGYGFFSHTFRSRVFLTTPWEIQVNYEGGGLKHLQTHWKFREFPYECCEIDFFVDFSFGPGLLQGTIETVFAKAVSQMIQAFEQRAKNLYGLDREKENKI